MYVKMRRDGIGSYISDKIDHCFHNMSSGGHSKSG